MRMTTNNPATAKKCIDQTELIWLAGAVIFGTILRLSFPGRMAIEHFDEGVYASNFWFGGNPYPAQYLYAPPLLPSAIEWTMIIASLCGIKPTGFVPMIPSLAAGIATIPSIWWFGRRWFGSTAGLASAWLVATSDFHACYSRAALTDVPVCLFILWAVYYIGESFSKVAVRHGEVVKRGKSKAISPVPLPWKEILLAGVFTGLAWWTKYNGWLPLAIGLAGGTFWQMLTSPPDRRIRATLTCWILIALVACIVWSPVLWGLQKKEIGGYAAVAANHRQYIVGFKGWSDSALTQMYNIGKYENPLEILYVPFINRGFRIWHTQVDGQLAMNYLENGQWRGGVFVLQRLLFENLTPLFVPGISLLLSTWICARFLLKSRLQPQLLFVCLVAAWFAGLTFATPFYHPYPRLVLPWLCSTWVCIAFWLQSCQLKKQPEDSVGVDGRKLTIVVSTIVAAISIRLLCGSANVWQDRSGLQSMVGQFAGTIRTETSNKGFAENEAIIYVFAEPAIVFGLRSEGLHQVFPAGDLEFMHHPIQRPTYVAFSSTDSSMPRDMREDLMSARFERADGQLPHKSHLVTNEQARLPFGVEETKLFRLFK